MIFILFDWQISALLRCVPVSHSRCKLRIAFIPQLHLKRGILLVTLHLSSSYHVSYLNYDENGPFLELVPLFSNVVNITIIMDHYYAFKKLYYINPEINLTPLKFISEGQRLEFSHGSPWKIKKSRRGKAEKQKRNLTFISGKEAVRGVLRLNHLKCTDEVELSTNLALF